MILNCKKELNINDYLTKYEGLNYNKVQALFRKKDIKVNNKKVDKDYLLTLNDEIRIFTPLNYFYDIKTIYEDDNIIIVDKPKKLEVISETRNVSLINFINSSYFAVHRLDFNTEGLVVIAKNLNSKTELDNAFKNGQVEKKYVTICKNCPNKNEMTFVDYLIKGDSKVKIVKNEEKNSKQIVTIINSLEKSKNYSLLNVTLKTGRTHQIRAHLAFHNLFVLGDDKYGDFNENKKLNLKSQILKCYYLKFNFLESSKLSYLNKLTFETSFENIKTYFKSLK